MAASPFLLSKSYWETVISVAISFSLTQSSNLKYGVSQQLTAVTMGDSDETDQAC
jgi:type II secretory pathway component PulC